MQVLGHLMLVAKTVAKDQGLAEGFEWWSMTARQLPIGLPLAFVRTRWKAIGMATRLISFRPSHWIVAVYRSGVERFRAVWILLAGTVVAGHRPGWLSGWPVQHLSSCTNSMSICPVLYLYYNFVIHQLVLNFFHIKSCTSFYDFCQNNKQKSVW